MSYAILVPCYNAEQFIEGFLNNLTRQILPFDEVVFYDDASTDGTYNHLTAKGYSVLKGDKNRGPGYARNQLAANCKSQWIHFHDIDDELEPEYLVKTSAIVESNASVDVVLCNVDWHDAASRQVLLSWSYSNSQINENTVAYTIAHPIGGINGLYRKSKFTEAGGFNTEIRIWEDADLHVKLAENKSKFHVIEEVLCRALRYNNSASANQHHGWLTRLDLLTAYAKNFKGRAEQKEIGRQANLAASNFILLGDASAATKALRLSESCGVTVPDNKSTLWRILKTVLPAGIRIPLRVFQLRTAFRK
ncbi:glycosyltransferase family 2 protein [Mucilaginibacter sp. HD30]